MKMDINLNIIILVEKIISKVLPSKWYKGVQQYVLIYRAIDVPIQENMGWFGTPVECPQTWTEPPPVWTLAA